MQTDELVEKAVKSAMLSVIKEHPMGHWRDDQVKEVARRAIVETALSAAEPVGEPLELPYKNWRGEISTRKIQPIRIEFGATEWHPEPQWLLVARDIEKNAERSFALRDFNPPQSIEPSVAVKALELDSVPDALASGKGIWRTCTGCHESNEGYPTGPFNDTLKCHLGGGCFECGGIGAVWDRTNYEDMGNYIAASAQVQDAPEKVGRFGHHPKPAIDFCIEVEALEGHLFDAKHGIGKPGHEPRKIDDEFRRRVSSAMEFIVGGDQIAIAAKTTLRSISTQVQDVAGWQSKEIATWEDQQAFEAWAQGERYEMHQHPLHYLFIDPETNAARQGWKAALQFIRDRYAATPAKQEG